jgi:hypothetical protein
MEQVDPTKNDDVAAPLNELSIRSCLKEELAVTIAIALLKME